MSPTITATQRNNKCIEKKIKGSKCSRVHRIKLSTPLSTSPYERISNSNNNIISSNLKNCISCNDSGNSLNLITERLTKIEGLVNNLYKLTQGLQNSKKNSPCKNNLKPKNQLLQDIDLSSYKLDDLQKLVVYTTNAMSAPSSQKSVPPKFIYHVHQEGKVRPEKNSGKKSTTTQQKDETKCDNQDSERLIDLKPCAPPAIQEDDSKENENHVPVVRACENKS